MDTDFFLLNRGFSGTDKLGSLCPVLRLPRRPCGGDEADGANGDSGAEATAEGNTGPGAMAIHWCFGWRPSGNLSK